SGLALDWDDDYELLEQGTVQRLAGHFRNLLSSMAEGPQTTLDHLNLLTATERQQLLIEWNSTKMEIPNAACIHELIEQSAKASPNAIAVTCRNAQLTYSELNARANQVASYLANIGVGPETLVGI